MELDGTYALQMGNMFYFAFYFTMLKIQKFKIMLASPLLDVTKKKQMDNVKRTSHFTKAMLRNEYIIIYVRKLKFINVQQKIVRIHLKP